MTAGLIRTSKDPRKTAPALACADFLVADAPSGDWILDLFG
jgi:hypothetical protein